MKTIFPAIIFFYVLIVFGDELPPGVPNPVGPDGKDTDGLFFTTRKYEVEAYRLVLQEANKVAAELKLSENMPIAKSDVKQVYISPFGMSWAFGGVGNVMTEKYVYCVSLGKKFCFLEGTHQDEDCRKHLQDCQLPLSEVDTNKAYQMATQWLSAVSMDVKALNHDLHLIVEVDNVYVQAPPGKFVPIYWVAWCKKWKPLTGVIYSDPSEWEAVASVRFFAPTKTLLQLRVEDPKYILRPPIVFTNLAELLSTNVPASPHASFER